MNRALPTLIVVTTKLEELMQLESNDGLTGNELIQLDDIVSQLYELGEAVSERVTQ